MVDGGIVRCSINQKPQRAVPPEIDLDDRQVWQPSGIGAASLGQLGVTRTFDIAAGDKATYQLVRQHAGPLGSPDSNVTNSVLTAVFTSAP